MKNRKLTRSLRSLVRLRFFTTREKKLYALTNHEVIYISSRISSKRLTRLALKSEVKQKAVITTIKDYVSSFMEAADESIEEPIDETNDEP